MAELTSSTRRESNGNVIEKHQHAFEAAKAAGREPYKVQDLSLAEFGRKEIRLAEQEMPGLMSLRSEHAQASRSPARGSWAACT